MALLSSSALPGVLTPAETRQLTGDARDVIVILKDQLPNVPSVRGARSSRAAALGLAQSPILAELQKSGAAKIHSFGLINAVSARISQAEAEHLAAHPLVQKVVTDRVIRLRPPAHLAALAGTGGAAKGSASSAPTDGGLCNTLEPEALQLINAAFADAATPQAQTVVDGNGIPVTGVGVKVAFIADGLDPTIAGFVRPDGTSAFIDYQDFSGDPAGTPTGGGEAFGDASSIGAQDTPYGTPLLFDISQFVAPADPLPSPCDIRVRGVAPGASLVGLKAFSAINVTTNSAIVQAIDYAVNHDDVDVINESFGSNPFPDDADDPLSLANHAAVEAGVTVVVSTGDGGSAGTLGAPATDPYVIAAGASTQFRLYQQTGAGGEQLAKGYLSNNISSLSSGGFSLGARTVDVVAPGDLGWALCSTDQKMYPDCGSNNITVAAYPDGEPTPVYVFGGTSEAAPLTSGTAALVIQAYRSTHHGTSPSPGTVKRIILSTATDLGAPASEQGNGLINALAAVQSALSLVDENGVPKPKGAGIFAAPTSGSISALPHTAETLSFTITNTGTASQHLTPALQALGPPIAGAKVTVPLASGDKTFLDEYGVKRSYVEKSFTVPAGAQHLDAAIAFTGSSSDVRISLLDPAGRLAAYSLPQGFGNGYGHVDVVAPAPGTWTAVIWTVAGNPPYTYSGPVQFTWAAEKFVNVGSVSPANFQLAPGASRTITVSLNLPAEPGDSALAVRFGGAGTAQPEIPITLRTLIPLSSTGGVFTGTLTGGNGRAYVGPTSTYEFVVPTGVNDLGLTLEIADNGYLLEGLLVDPNGMELAVDGNLDPAGNPQYGLQEFLAKPQAGTWKFILVQNFTSSGNQTSLPFTARIGLNTARVAAPALPNDKSVILSAKAGPVTIPIILVNTGAVTEAFFADARLTTTVSTALAPSACSSVTTLPGACGLFYLPTEVSEAQFVSQSKAPINMDAFNAAGYGVGGTGSPDIYATKSGAGSVTAAISEPEVPWGPWIAQPALIGPYGSAGALTAPVNNGALVLMKPFDPAVSADTGDIWADLVLGTNTYNPLVLGSGDPGVIHVTITPNPHDVGKTVTGYIYIDTFNDTLFTGDEVVRIPYTYTIGK